VGEVEKIPKFLQYRLVIDNRVAWRIPLLLDTMRERDLKNKNEGSMMPSRIAPLRAAWLAALITTGIPQMVQAEDPANEAAEKVLRHVVLFQFSEETSDQQVQEIEEGFAELPDKIDTIIDFEWGTDVSVEDRSQGFTHCFLVTFADQEGLAKYLPHPAHQGFVKLLKPRLARLLVVDYWARK
jgi:hypothetical protein